MTKFVEFLILSKLDKASSNLIPLAFYVDLSIKTKQIKYMDRAKDLIDWEMSNYLKKSDS